MVLGVRLLLLLLCMQTGTLSVRAALLSATCFPTLAEHRAVATSDLSSVGPTHKVFCNGNQSGFWTYNTRPAPPNRACLDLAECLQAPNHVALTWLPGASGNGLSEYNISFEGMWIAFSPGLTKRAVFLSLGWCFVISGRNGLDSGTSGPDWFGVNNSGFGAGSFHSFFIEVTMSYTKVNMDGRLVFEDGGVGMKNYLNNRDCQPLGHYSTGAMFGGMMIVNGRSLFSRVEGQVRNVRLETDIPDAVARLTTVPPQGGHAPRTTGPTQAGGHAAVAGGPATTAGGSMQSGGVVARHISGNFEMTVNNAAAFVSDPEAKAGVQWAIAIVSGVSRDKVQVTLEITPPLRLDAGIQRLNTSSSVRVDYVIHLPVGSPSSGVGSASSVKSSLERVTTRGLTLAVTSALSGSSTSYSVVVTHNENPTVITVTNLYNAISDASWDIFCWPLLMTVALWHLFSDRRES